MKPRISNSFLTALLALLLTPAAGAFASTSASDSVHFCVPFDYDQWRHDHPRPAGKRAAGLNVGEPRTVRMVYFLPNDRPYRAQVVRNMKDRAREVRQFYAESMQARGNGDKTIQFETNAAGAPLVHRVNAQHPDSHYINETFVKVLEEIEQAFDTEQNVYLAVIDISTDVINRWYGGRGTRIGKTGGFGLVTSNEMDPFNYHNVVTHELGHTFGLQHDFRKNTHVMSYGYLPNSEISACNSDFLAVHPYFNPDVTIEAGTAPAIERISPLTYPDGAKSVSIQLEVADPDGLHQVMLLVESGDGVADCRGLSGQRNAVVTFDYDGFIPNSGITRGVFSTLSDESEHPLVVRAVDLAGNVSDDHFSLTALKSESNRPRPETLEKISGDGQRGEPGSTLAAAMVVEVRDQYGDPIPNVQVTFTVTAGGGRLSERFSLENVTTDANGRAERVLTLGPNPGANAVEVTLGDLAVETFRAVGNGQPVAVPGTDGGIRTLHLPDGATARIGKGRLVLNDKSVAFSPDGKLLAVARQIGVWLYDAVTSRPLALLPMEEKAMAMSFSPDGGTLATSVRHTHKENIQIWDIATGARKNTIWHIGWVKSLAFSGDGTLLVSVTLENRITFWDTKTWREVASFGGGGTTTWLDDPVSISLHPDGTLLALGSYDSTIQMWHVKTGDRVATLDDHRYHVASVTFSRDGAILASGSWDRTVKLWDVAAGRIINTLEGHNDRVNSVAFSRDGKTLASASGDGAIRLWNVATGVHVATLEGLSGGVETVAFSPDGTLVSAYSDGTVKLWDISTRGVIEELEIESSVTSVAFSGDGTILALGSDDAMVKLVDPITGGNVSALEGHTAPVTAVDFLSDGTTLTSGAHAEIMLWDTATLSNMISPNSSHILSPIDSFFRSGCAIASLVASPDGKTIASGGNPEIVFWDTETKEQTAIASPANNVSFSPDGKILASMWAADGTVDLWDVATKEKIETMHLGHHSVSGGGFVLFSPDGKSLAIGTDYTELGRIIGSVRLWDLATKKNIASVEGNWSQSASGAFSPDGKLLAAGWFSGAIRLWDLTSKEVVATLRGHRGWVNSLSFSPDGTTLASGSRDGTVLLWDTAPYVTPRSAPADFDGDGKVGFPDFLLFAAQFGLSEDDAGYDAQFDLDSDGAVGFSDFLIFAESFGQ